MYGNHGNPLFVFTAVTGRLGSYICPHCVNVLDASCLINATTYSEVELYRHVKNLAPSRPSKH